MSRITDALRKAAAERDARLKEGAPPEERTAQPPDPVPVVEEPSEPEVAPAAEAPPAAVHEAVPPQSVEQPRLPSGLRVVRVGGVDEHVVHQSQPNSQCSEQFRVLREQLRGGATGSPPEILVVTSADNTPSRPVSSLNLALAFAEDKSISVLVIDGNLRDPSFDALLSLPAGPGLADCLAGRCEAKGVLVSWEGVDNLRVLTAGSLSGSAATELLSSARMADTLGGFREAFDCVIIDMPSPIHLADTRQVAPLAEGVLIVAEAGKTRREVIHRAQSRLAEARARVLGVALTDVQRVIPDFIYRHL